MGVAPVTQAVRNSTRPFLLLSAALLLYGNAIAYADRVLFPGAWPFAAVMGLVVSLGLLAWAVWGAGLSWRELGVADARAALRGAARGGVLGLALAAAALAAIALFSAPWGGVSYPPVAGISASEVVLRLLVTMPLDTTLLEEIAFRGVLLALALRAMSVPRAVLVSSGVFTMWHVVVNYHTLAHTSLAESMPLVLLGVALTHLGVFIGGLAFCLVRLRMGGLAASFAMHWAVNIGLLLAFWVA